MALNFENSAAVTHNASVAGVTSGDMNSANFNGLLLFINITAISGTSPTLTATLQGKSPTGVYYPILVSTALTTTGLTVLRVYPGLIASANLTANDIMPAAFRVITAIGGTSPVVTATLSTVLVS